MKKTSRKPIIISAAVSGLIAGNVWPVYTDASDRTTPAAICLRKDLAYDEAIPAFKRRLSLDLHAKADILRDLNDWRKPSLANLFANYALDDRQCNFSFSRLSYENLKVDFSRLNTADTPRITPQAPAP